MGTGCQNFSGVQQAIERPKNITSGREPYSDRDPFLKRRLELIMHVMLSIKDVGNTLAFN